MDMAAQTVDHPACIAICLHIAPDILLRNHFKPGMAVLFPMGLVGHHLAYLLFGEGSKKAALDQIAVDAVPGDTAADDLSALQRHGAETGRLVVAVAPGDGLEIAAVAEIGRAHV